MVDVSGLVPYKSFLLFRLRQGEDERLCVRLLIEDIVTLLREENSDEVEILEVAETLEVGNLEHGYVHYTKSNIPSWYSGQDLFDTTNHIILVSRRGRGFTIYCSESNLGKTIRRRVGTMQGQGPSMVESIPPEILNAAFLTGSAKALWLSGVHRRTSIKADNKILSGIDLRDALDPLSDQTYHLTAARSQANIDGISQSIGVTPLKSKAWIGPSSSWLQYNNDVSALLNHIEAVEEPLHQPIPIVAVASQDVSLLHGPFDMAIILPEELLLEPAEDLDAKARLQLWGDFSSFSNLESTPNQDGTITVSADMHLERTLRGRTRIKIFADTSGTLRFEVGGTPVAGQENEFEFGASLLAKRELVKIWFDSGHTVSNGSIFKLTFRDIPFNQFQWGDFAGIDIGKEKPNPIDQIGNQDSLFDWVKNCWPNLDANAATGWLACDDGAMEVADFLHLDAESQPPILSFIHIKASSTVAANRQVSVSDYEVVIGQAVKNLRHFDSDFFGQNFIERIQRKIGTLVWHNGAPSNRQNLLEAFESIGLDYERRVYVIQPRIKRTMLEQANVNRNSAEYRRLLQLYTLLHGAASACRSLQADLIVVGSA